MEIRLYDRQRDLAAVQRVWREIGWISTEAGAECLADFLAVGRSYVAALDGEAKALVHAVPGAMRYQDGDAPICAVTAATTSLVARGRGMALRLTARQVADGALAGAEVAVLGVFDQGFYDRLGFGTGSYDHYLRFDPATLAVDAAFRPPKRLTAEDAGAVHGAMLMRRRGHGGCVLHPPEVMQAELVWRPNGFGLGYEADGTLTHCVWMVAEGGALNRGPYSVQMLAYRTPEQLLELLAMLKSLADQISLIEMCEPQDIQLQSLLLRPFRHRRSTRSGDAAYHHAEAWWQLRVLDVAACVARRRWAGEAVRFNLELTDPVSAYLPQSPWRGCQGDYRITIAENALAEPGRSPGWPSLKASVNAFSRLWFGVAPASSLAITDGLETDDAALLPRLDEALRLPQPRLGWDF